MAAQSFESRLTALEEEVARLKTQMNENQGKSWKNIIGAFANDPLYEEAMKIGRQWRESTRPKTKRKKRKNTNGRS